jgi:hypothetical protein
LRKEEERYQDTKGMNLRGLAMQEANATTERGVAESDAVNRRATTAENIKTSKFARKQAEQASKMQSLAMIIASTIANSNTPENRAKLSQMAWGK